MRAQVERKLSDYDVAVNDWLMVRRITFTIERTGESKGFPGGIERAVKDKTARPLWHDTYAAKFTRDLRDVSTGEMRHLGTLHVPEFYQSAARSRASISRNLLCNRMCGVRYGETPVHRRGCPGNLANFAEPTAYDILSAITKSDPSTFADFCGEFGYDTDSRRAMDTYLVVQKEWTRVRAFFTAKELGELQEIAS